MIGLLRLMAIMSVTILIATFSYQKYFIAGFFNGMTEKKEIVTVAPSKQLQAIEINEPALVRVPAAIEQKVDPPHMIKLREIENELKAFGSSCRNALALEFRGKDLIDPNSEVFKNWANVEAHLNSLERKMKSMQAHGDKISKEIGHLMQTENIVDASLWDQLLLVFDKKMDTCRSQELHNFLSTLPETMAKRGWPNSSKTKLEGFYQRYAKYQINSGQSLPQVYRGLGIIKMAMAKGIFEELDQDYLNQLHSMIEERKGEFRYQYDGLSNSAEKRIFIEEELRWRDDFKEEILDFLQS